MFPRLAQSDLRVLTADAGRRACAPLLTAGARALMARARAEEVRLGYAAPDGKYWKTLDRLDPAALRRIDALWLEAARRSLDSLAA